MIRIIDYGLGNVEAFMTLYKAIGVDIRRAKNSDELCNASKIILPGVGSFDYAVKSLQNSGMIPLISQMVLKEKVPFLGVCVGMQLLASSSDEGVLSGLNWVPGRVTKFKTELPLPHMGWNKVEARPGNPLFSGLEPNSEFYFLHSYYYEVTNPLHVSAESIYGKNFGCAISLENIYGVQFHPEKSHNAGIKLLKNFAAL